MGGLSHFIRTYNYRNNLEASMNILNSAIRSQNVSCVVFTSSIAVYGAAQVPMTENTIPIPEDPYGISKYAVELDLKAAHEMFGLPYIIFRPHNVYGPGQNMYDKYRNVVGIFLNQLVSGRPLTIFGDGKQTRAFSYVADVAAPIAQSPLFPHAHNQIFNVGADQAYTLNELAETLSANWDGSTGVVHLDARKEVAHAESSHDKLRCFFPHLPSPLSLQEGLKKMVVWVKNYGINLSPVQFKAVEIKRNLPPSWITPGLEQVAAVTHTEEDNLAELATNGPDTPSTLHQSMRVSKLHNSYVHGRFVCNWRNVTSLSFVKTSLLSEEDLRYIEKPTVFRRACVTIN